MPGFVQIVKNIKQVLSEMRQIVEILMAGCMDCILSILHNIPETLKVCYKSSTYTPLSFHLFHVQLDDFIFRYIANQASGFL